jgi:hypothetical protein
MAQAGAYPISQVQEVGDAIEQITERKAGQEDQPQIFSAINEI